MSDSYNIFSSVYDDLTENVNYEVRSDYISGFLNRNGIKSGKMLDLACGTGSFSKQFEDKGFDITGVDLSADMLTVAMSKLQNAELICASMCDYVNENEFDCAICMLDSVNHLTDINDVQLVFDNVYKSLKEGGMFIFDVNTVYKHNKVLADNTFVFDSDDYYLVWDNELESDREVRILLDIFIWNGESYDRYNEEFNEYAYTIAELKEMLNNSGFENIKIYDELTDNEPNDESERLYFVCVK